MINSKVNPNLLKQIIRYLFVGGIATLMNYMIFIFLFKFCHTNYIIASATGYILSVVAGYFFNRKWTFNATEAKAETIVKYMSVYICSLLISMALLSIFVEWLLLPAEWANVLTISVTIFSNFLGLKFLVFRNTSSRQL
jgi:putative flippase GtrA